MGLSQQQARQLYGTDSYAGWGETEAAADAKAKGISAGNYSSNSSSNTSSSQSMDDYFRKQNELQQQAIAPAIQSLQASIPTIKTNYGNQISQKQAELQPLQDRYKSLIEQIKGTGQTSVNKQTVVTAGELGKRGIEGSSTLAGQEIANATLPIEQQTQSLVKDTGFAQEADIRDINNAVQNLGGQQTEKEQAIQQAIAQLQAGGGQTAIQNAMTLLANAQASDSAKATATETSRQNDIKNALAQLSTNNETALTQAQINQINSNIAKTNKESTPTNTNQYYTPGTTGVSGVAGNYKSQAGGTVLPQAKSWSTQ